MEISPIGKIPEIENSKRSRKIELYDLDYFFDDKNLHQPKEENDTLELSDRVLMEMTLKQRKNLKDKDLEKQ